MSTTWPVIWSRTLRSHNAVARHNALAAARVLRERRAEREEVERGRDARHLIGMAGGYVLQR